MVISTVWLAGVVSSSSSVLFASQIASTPLTPKIVTDTSVAKKAKKRPQCADGRDNDGDGRIDYPNDRGCTSRRDRSERTSKSRTPASLPGTPSLGVGASLHGKQLFPDDNPWNQNIAAAPVDPNSANLIASIGLDTALHPDFGTVWEGAPIGIPYVVVSGTQSTTRPSFDYSDESDRGPYPIPANPPIEGGATSDGDRHILIVDRDHWKLFELYSAYPRSGGWQAGSGAIFDLKSNTQRPAGWTSADAAGLPIFPGLVRYDEVVEQKAIKHALRFTARYTRRAYVAPARHFASNNSSPNLPPMGMRVRLKSSFDISRFPANVQVILQALKDYGMLLADNGSNWFISGAPDSRWNDDELGTLRQVHGRDFEVVQMGTITTQ